MRKRIFLFIILILLLIPVFIFGQRPLEVEYPLTPEGEAPTHVETTTFAEYVRYIYNISFIIAAIIAFVAFIYAGVLYLSSAGNPSKLKEAKERMLSALLGIGILLIAYLLLLTINPDLIMLATLELKEIPSSEYISPLKELRSQRLGTVKEIGIMGNLATEGIHDLAEDIFLSSMFCNCFNARGLCLCTGGGEGNKCEPQICYASEDAEGHPCSNYNDIREWQEIIAFWMDELVYYQNRAVGTDLFAAANIEEAEEEILKTLMEDILAGRFEEIFEDLVNAGIAGYFGGEAKALQKDIINVSYPTIEYYENYISSLPAEGDPRIRETLNQILNKEEGGRDLKQDLLGKLVEFGFLVEAIKEPIDQLTHLTEQCALNTQNHCDPHCFGECHNTFIGCQAVCIGLNPCPVFDIAIAWGVFELLEGELENTTKDIADLVDEIRQLEK